MRSSRARDKPLDAVVGTDEQGVLVAALAAARLGLAHNPPEAVAATRDKTAMRGAFAAAGLRQPDYRVAGPTRTSRSSPARSVFPAWSRRFRCRRAAA